MALDTTCDHDGSRLSFQITLEELDLFEPAFATLERKTGNFIDPYGRAWIYPDHQKILVDALAQNADVRVKAFRQFLETTIRMDAVLFAEDD